MVAVAPNSRTRSSLGAEQVPRTFPNPSTLRAYWTAKEPTPPAAACIKIVCPLRSSPGSSPACSKTCITVRDTRGKAAACSSGIVRGALAKHLASATVNSERAPHGEPTKGSIPYTASPMSKPDPSPAATTTPLTSKPNVRGLGTSASG